MESLQPNQARFNVSIAAHNIVVRLAAKVAFCATLFLAFSAHAYQCDVDIQTLVQETYKFSEYQVQENVNIWPLSIREIKDTKEFNNYAGGITRPDVAGLYLDNRELIFHTYRESVLTKTQSCALIVHEICHHLQNIHEAKRAMTRGQREAECYLVQKNYVVYYADRDWNKRGNPMPLGPNGFQTVKEFKMIQRAKAASPDSDFNIDDFDCHESLEFRKMVCERYDKK